MQTKGFFLLETQTLPVTKRIFGCLVAKLSCFSSVKAANTFEVFYCGKLNTEAAALIRQQLPVFAALSVVLLDSNSVQCSTATV